MDNEKVSQGWEPVSNNRNWEKVDKMTDKYALNNPTMVVMPCNAGPHTDPCNSYVAPNPGGGGGGTGGGGGYDGPPPCIEGEPCGHRIHLGSAKLVRDYDGWLAGGSVIRFKSIDAVRLLSGDDYELKRIGFYVDFNRDEINDKEWESIYSQFDQDWEEYELQKPLRIYEGDGNGTDEIDLSIKIDKGPVNISLGTTFDISNDRDDIYKTYYQREQFLANNDESFQHGKKMGDQIRYAGGFYWTFSVTEFQY